MSTITVTKEDALATLSPPSVRVLAEPTGLVPSTQGNGHTDQSTTGTAKTGTGKTGTSNTQVWLRLLIVALSIVAVVVGWLITVHYTHDTAINFGSAAAKPVDGLTIFAVFFVAAAAIERFLEPISGLLPDKADKNKEAQDSKTEAGTKLSKGEDATQELQKAADKQRDANEWVFGQTIGFWALATILGIIASAMLKLYLPYVVGIASGGRAIQILATGLIIGAGTKPLHDFIGYMTAAKDAKEG